MKQSNTIKQIKSLKRDLYFTHNHEWIDFQGSIAYTGVCPFKLKGIKNIDKIVFSQTGIICKAGDKIGSIYYADYKIDIHIPVTGRILSFNDDLLKGNKNILLDQPENSGWVALVIPSSPYDRTGLVIAEQYRRKTTSLC